MFWYDNLPTEGLQFRLGCRTYSLIFCTVGRCDDQNNIADRVGSRAGDRTCGWICRHKGRTILSGSKRFQSNGRLSPLSPSPINQPDSPPPPTLGRQLLWQTPLQPSTSCYRQYQPVTNISSPRNLKKCKKKDYGKTRGTCKIGRTNGLPRAKIVICVI